MSEASTASFWPTVCSHSPAFRAALFHMFQTENIELDFGKNWSWRPQKIIQSTHKKYSCISVCVNIFLLSAQRLRVEPHFISLQQRTPSVKQGQSLITFFFFTFMRHFQSARIHEAHLVSVLKKVKSGTIPALSGWSLAREKDSFFFLQTKKDCSVVHLGPQRLSIQFREGHT